MKNSDSIMTEWLNTIERRVTRMEESKKSKLESFKEFCMDNMEIVIAVGTGAFLIGTAAIQTRIYKNHLKELARIYDRNSKEYFMNCACIFAKKLGL